MVSVPLVQSVYIGCTNGSVLCIDPESSAVLGSTTAPDEGQTAVAAAAVSSIAVNKDAVVTACSTSPQVLFYSRAVAAVQDKQQHHEKAVLQLFGSVQASTQGGHVRRPCCNSVSPARMLH